MERGQRKRRGSRGGQKSTALPGRRIRTVRRLQIRGGGKKKSERGAVKRTQGGGQTDEVKQGETLRIYSRVESGTRGHCDWPFKTGARSRPPPPNR